MFVVFLPISMIWRIASNCLVPGADTTLNRPIAGRFIKWLASDIKTITRKRDQSWETFKLSISDDAIMIFLPEGRMKRPDGLDKNGQPMTVRKGIVEVLALLGSGRMLLCYSGGLHQVQAPGEAFPKFFKAIAMRFELVEIETYLQPFANLAGTPEYAVAIAKDLELRRDRHCPRVERFEEI